MKKEYVIAIDVGGTKILTALISDKKKIIDRIKLATDATKGGKFIIECVSDSIKQVLKQTSIKIEQVKAISIGVPGTVNPESGILANAPNLHIKNFNIRKMLQKDFNVPIFLENDVNLAGLGIKIYEYKNKVNNMLVVFVGTGIGGALFFNGKMYRGSSFYAGEIGHMLVDGKGALGNGKDATQFEHVASRTAIVNSIIEKSKKNKTYLAKYIKKGEKIKSKHLAKAIAKDDKLVKEVISDACKVIGTLLGSITTLLNLDTIVVGGGAVEANEDFMLPKIRKAFNDAVIKEAGKIVKIKGTKLGDDAALYGGLGLAEEFLK
ncbi:MAG: ROK family protein [Melioribacteraceae bacterium]